MCRLKGYPLSTMLAQCKTNVQLTQMYFYAKGSAVTAPRHSIVGPATTVRHHFFQAVSHRAGEPPTHGGSDAGPGRLHALPELVRSRPEPVELRGQALRHDAPYVLCKDIQSSWSPTIIIRRLWCSGSVATVKLMAFGGGVHYFHQRKHFKAFSVYLHFVDC